MSEVTTLEKPIEQTIPKPKPFRPISLETIPQTEVNLTDSVDSTVEVNTQELSQPYIHTPINLEQARGELVKDLKEYVDKEYPKVLEEFKGTPHPIASSYLEAKMHPDSNPLSTQPLPGMDKYAEAIKNRGSDRMATADVPAMQRQSRMQRFFFIVRNFFTGKSN